MALNEDSWAMFRRPPVVIPEEEREAVERQWAIYARMTPAARLELGLEMTAIALRQRRERLQRQFPHADERGISWAVIREILQLPSGTDPVPP